MSGNDWQEVVGVIGVFLLLTTVIGVTVWQVAASWRAKALLAREDVYREIAEKATRSHEETERRLAEFDTRFAEIRAKLDSIERVLKDVD